MITYLTAVRERPGLNPRDVIRSFRLCFELVRMLSQRPHAIRRLRSWVDIASDRRLVRSSTRIGNWTDSAPAIHSISTVARRVEQSVPASVCWRHVDLSSDRCYTTAKTNLWIRSRSNLRTNFRPTIALCGWSNVVPIKSNMAAGRHLEKIDMTS